MDYVISVLTGSSDIFYLSHVYDISIKCLSDLNIEKNILSKRCFKLTCQIQFQKLHLILKTIVIIKLNCTNIWCNCALYT